MTASFRIWVANGVMAVTWRCCFLNLDGFKPSNDQRGYAVGDAVLREVARRLLGRVRGMDTVVRFGGDELVCRPI